ncbi:hypothetical protein NMY22_g4622 [Coprinellus aureogranulatus]|nr:hypothetical protein NMY22_g4622 [Coprinellus aureogranulatus]
MPVSPRGFESWVEVDGRRLRESNVEYRGSTVVCTVPCKAGKEFKIGCSIPGHRLRATNHAISIDLGGKPAVLRDDTVYQNGDAIGPWTRRFSEQLAKEDAATRSFRFGTLNQNGSSVIPHLPAVRASDCTAEGDRSLPQKPTKHAVEIIVYFSSIAGFTTVSSHRLPDHVGGYRVHQTARKGMAHCVKLGEAEPCTPVKAHSKAIGKKAECKFVFSLRYRSTGQLPQPLCSDWIAPSIGNAYKRDAVASVPQTVPRFKVSTAHTGRSFKPPSTRNREDAIEEEEVARLLLNLENGEEATLTLEDRLAALRARRVVASAQSQWARSRPPITNYVRERSFSCPIASRPRALQRANAQPTPVVYFMPNIRLVVLELIRKRETGYLGQAVTAAPIVLHCATRFMSRAPIMLLPSTRATWRKQSQSARRLIRRNPSLVAFDQSHQEPLDSTPRPHLFSPIPRATEAENKRKQLV